MADEITIVLRDKIARQVARLPNPQEFVNQAVEHALHNQGLPAQMEAPSKWARLVAEIESLPGLGDYEETFRKDQKEFRRSFRFKHDEP
ncbi:MAG TPA: hypothetical protein VFR31_21535 [Thermoanaerobaculia bacterium]|nr:hypothetical protein [Thermoanaerobaculia bacterium]